MTRAGLGFAILRVLPGESRRAKLDHRIDTDGQRSAKGETMRKADLRRTLAWAALAVPVMISAMAAAQAPAPTPAPAPAIAPALPPNRVVNLMTAEGVAAFGAQWRTMPVKIVEIPHIPNAKPEYQTTYDIQPHAGESGFDDSKWPTIEAKSLSDRLGGGKVSMIWYRTNLTIPEKVGDFDTAGAKAVFAVAIDDYAEVWVNGQMPRRVGVPSPATIQGFNMPNRVVLADSVKPGDKFQIAVFGINGPISVSPENFIFVRQAQVELFR
jgi:gluconolactonase